MKNKPTYCTCGKCPVGGVNILETAAKLKMTTNQVLDLPIEYVRNVNIAIFYGHAIPKQETHAS